MRQDRQKGAVLVLVLWLVALLTFLLAAFTATVKVERQAAADIGGYVQGRASALGVLNYLAAIRMLEGQQWSEMLGQVYKLQLNDTLVRFRVLPENAFVSLNSAPADTLAKVFQAAGVQDAETVAENIVAWRSGGVDQHTGETVQARTWLSFNQMVKELALDLDVLQQYQHWFTVDAQHAQVNLEFADAALREILHDGQMDVQPGDSDGQALVEGKFGLAWFEKTPYRVQVELTGAANQRQVEAVTDFDGTNGYRVIRWNEYNMKFLLD